MTIYGVQFILPSSAFRNFEKLNHQEEDAKQLDFSNTA
jgi:hypothetical protein